MESTFVIKSDGGNYYLINIKSKHIMLLNPLMYFILTDQYNVEDEETRLYYKSKFEYLKTHNIIANKPDQTDQQIPKITTREIQENISNLGQLTFEVTSKCNLNCKYCIYGELYEGDEYKKTPKKNIPSIYTQNILDYLDKQQTFNKTIRKKSDLYISFYGGEPLLNVKLIQSIIDNINKNKGDIDFIKYNMTTNGVLLNKHIEVLHKNNIHILVSLDGNRNNNAYRVYLNKKNSFDRIYRNLKKIQSDYPLYFNDNVSFNAVLHNKTSVDDIYTFFKQEFDKQAKISELSNSGVQDNKIAEFDNIYRDKDESLAIAPNREEIEERMFINAPNYGSVLIFINQHSPFVYKSYNHLYIKNENDIVTSGTCSPFAKKMFVTVDGEILPCEKVSRKYILGKIKENGIEIDYDYIVNKYNGYYNKLKDQCTKCYRRYSCSQCMFFIPDLENQPICHGFTNSSRFTSYLSSNISFLEKHPIDYYRMMTEINIS